MFGTGPKVTVLGEEMEKNKKVYTGGTKRGETEGTVRDIYKLESRGAWPQDDAPSNELTSDMGTLSSKAESGW